MSDEAKRVADKWFRSAFSGTFDEAVAELCKYIDAEFADVIAERDRLAKQVERLTDVLEMLGAGASASLSPIDDPDLPDAWTPDEYHQRLADWVMSSSMLCLEDDMTKGQIFSHNRNAALQEQPDD